LVYQLIVELDTWIEFTSPVLVRAWNSLLDYGSWKPRATLRLLQNEV